MQAPPLRTRDDEHLARRHVADALEADGAECAVLRGDAELLPAVAHAAAQHQRPEAQRAILTILIPGRCSRRLNCCPLQYQRLQSVPTFESDPFHIQFKILELKGQHLRPARVCRPLRDTQPQGGCSCTQHAQAACIASSPQQSSGSPGLSRAPDAVGVAEGDEAHALDQADAGVGPPQHAHQGPPGLQHQALHVPVRVAAGLQGAALVRAVDLIRKHVQQHLRGRTAAASARMSGHLAAHGNFQAPCSRLMESSAPACRAGLWEFLCRVQSSLAEFYTAGACTECHARTAVLPACHALCSRPDLAIHTEI